MKKLGFMIMFLFSLLVSSSVFAAVSNDYNIDPFNGVEVDGTKIVPTMFGGNEVIVERGQALPVDVLVHGFNNIDNIRVEASIKGYERGSIRAESDIFELDPNTDKKVSLVLDVPSDLDASKTYTLVVEVNDDRNGFAWEYSLRVKEQRHLLNVLDVIFRPSSTVEAGRILRSVVRVENLGAKIEKDIKVTISIPELGVSTRDFVDKLVTLNDKGDDESSLSTNELLLQIPKDAKEGDYDVKVDIEYNRGSDIVTLRKSVHVLGQKATADDSDAIISIDSTTKALGRNEETTFKLTFANLAENRKLYNVEAVGAGTWADISIEPSFLSVGANEAGELLVKVKSKENAALGQKVFTLKLTSDNKPLKEINLNVDVTEQTTGFGTPNLRKVLEVLFAVLILVLIVLALIIAFKRARGSEQGPGVETNSEQTYY